MSKPEYIDTDPLDSGPEAGGYQRDIVLSIPRPALELLPPPSLSVSAFLSNKRVYAPVSRQSALPQRVVFSHEVCDPNTHAIIKALKSRTTFPPPSIARGNEALKTRIRAFNTAKLKVGGLIGTAGVTPLSPVQTGSYAFVLFDGRIWFAEVLTMYSKGGGKAGKHGWVNKQNNMASLSNLSVQLWEHWVENDFRSVPKKTAVHYAKRYAHIRSQRVLYVVSSNEKLEVHTAELIRLNAALFTIWKGLNVEREGITRVVDELLKRRRKVNDEDDEDD